MFQHSPAVPWFSNCSSLVFVQRLGLCLVSRQDCACLGHSNQESHLLRCISTNAPNVS